MGITKVECEAELPAAMAEAFKFDSAVVCEAFIPLGREIRVAVVEDAGTPRAPTVAPAAGVAVRESSAVVTPCSAILRPPARAPPEVAMTAPRRASRPAAPNGLKL